MSEDPIEAIEQVLDRIDEGCCYGNNWRTGGWLHNASKEEIINFIYVNLRARVLNALRRTKEALEKPPRNCDRFNTGDVKMDAQHAMEAILEEGVAGYRGIAEYLLSPVKEEEPCIRATDATI